MSPLLEGCRDWGKLSGSKDLLYTFIQNHYPWLGIGWSVAEIQFNNLVHNTQNYHTNTLYIMLILRYDWLAKLLTMKHHFHNRAQNAELCGFM